MPVIGFPYTIYKGIQSPPNPGPVNRTDLLDYAGGGFVQSSRYIDPVTRDFVVSSNNHLQGMNAIDQGVLLAVNTTFNSSVQQSFGQNFTSIKVIPTNLTLLNQTVNTLLQQCLSSLINNNQIVLGKINISYSNVSQLSIQFYWTNLITNTILQSSILIGNN